MTRGDGNSDGSGGGESVGDPATLFKGKSAEFAYSMEPSSILQLNEKVS